MTTIRVALANLRYPQSPEDAITRTRKAIVDAGASGAAIVCFPECYLPGYRGLGHLPPPPDTLFLEKAWEQVASTAARARVAVVLGTERLVDGALVATALVIDRDGTRVGFQDKVQIDPSEEGTYVAAPTGRRVFRAAGITLGVAICHEGWRYPETVRFAVRHGAQVVFHPHLHEAEGSAEAPSAFGDPANTFHEKAALCRAAENTCYFATVNYASPRSATTSAVVRPDGTVLCYQPYEREGLLIADLDLDAATGLLAQRFRDIQDPYPKGVV